MKHLKTIFFIFLLIMISICYLSHSGSDEAIAAEEDAFQKINFTIDFTDYEQGSVDKWLEEKGFQFERGARDRKKVDLEVSEKGLVLDIRKSMLGFIVNEGVDLEEFTSIRLEWGISNYPEGASYEDGIRNEALMVMVFFGYDKISSGHFLIPNTPYFIGFFLGKEEKPGKAYKGAYFKKSGRYVCLGNPKEGETVISEYNLVQAFKRKYEKDEVPLISGIALATDTTKAKKNGKAGAFIKSIEFFE
jgi:hypothetical protein